jgi:DNA repair exonuclease SbcCD nuclease subunit
LSSARPFRSLVVGDPHVTPEEKDDCEKLLGLVERVASEEKVDVTIFTGDHYNNHDTVSTKVIEFWQRWHFTLKGKCKEVVVLKGNHDQTDPRTAFPHALLSHPEVFVVDGPKLLPFMGEGVVALPYYFDNEEFMWNARRLNEVYPAAHTLFCHATFQGAQYENGFFAKDGIDISQVPFKHVFSGHIHTPSKVGKAIYFGAPRARTRSDANIERYIYVLEHDGVSSRFVKRIRTGPVCRRLWSFKDYPEAPINPHEHTPGKDTLWVDVFGPDEKYVRDREAFLKATFGAETRGFPDRIKRSTISESEGIENAFQKFASDFVPPNGTSKELLFNMVEERLALS